MLFFTSSDVVEQWKEVGEGLGREEFLQKRGELKKHINAKNQLLIDLRDLLASLMYKL